MKTLLTFFLLSIYSFAFGQSPEPLQISITLSKGELLTIKQHEDDIKQNGPGIKQFFKRDSVYMRQFLPNTISPYIMPGDTLESWKIVGEKIELTFKPHKPRIPISH